MNPSGSPHHDTTNDLWREPSSWLSPDSPNASFEYLTGTSSAPGSPAGSSHHTPEGSRPASPQTSFLLAELLDYSMPAFQRADAGAGPTLDFGPDATWMPSDAAITSELANALGSTAGGGYVGSSRPGHGRHQSEDSPTIMIQPPSRATTMLTPPDAEYANSYGEGMRWMQGSHQQSYTYETEPSQSVYSDPHGSPHSIYSDLEPIDLSLDTSFERTVLNHQQETPASAGTPTHQVGTPTHQVGTPTHQAGTPTHHSPLTPPEQSYLLDQPISLPDDFGGANVRRSRSLTDNLGRIKTDVMYPLDAFGVPMDPNTYLTPSGQSLRGRSQSLRDPAGRGRGASSGSRSSHRTSPYNSRPTSRGHSPSSDSSLPPDGPYQHVLPAQPPASGYWSSAEIPGLSNGTMHAGLPMSAHVHPGMRPRGLSNPGPVRMHGEWGVPAPDMYRGMGGGGGVAPASIGLLPPDLVKPVVMTEGIAEAARKARKKEAKFICRFCQAGLTTRINRDNHEKAHQGIKEHKCTHCGDEFTRKADRDRHVQKMHIRPAATSTKVELGEPAKSGTSQPATKDER
ncbi:hypothetical protein PUNSTDRAFT_52079 [Punctularia strigosozonata HHB-11173 SS5]|uniref:uncharacterized protein n=1 Tax=Punctularia strigosozonata (strain HHB-11173) TaxID=741275 RepID=UPI0004417434|nr:uncharacterized protein PUNSTDRAFT_52079 [Punctularia strigosozonata HHB-11173 SS5]EIN09942.1 hypothetical protein PUNSTDRAFT_52079 [Punctularia strigosozonata HHB-11173 SS5]